MPKLALLLPLACLAALSATAAGAAPKKDVKHAPSSESTTPPAPALAPPYEKQLLHLARVLGSVDYLRQLCAKSESTEWRQMMQTLIDTEANGEEARTQRLTAAFNRGYRSFASVYVTCTDAAVAAEQKYRREGATLAREIAAKYGN